MSDASNVESLFFAALEKENPAERAAFLESACSNDAELRRQVDKLLKAHAKVGDFLKKPAVEQMDSEQDLAAATLQLDSNTDDQNDRAASGNESAPERTEGRLADTDETHVLEFLRPSTTQPSSLGRLGHYEVLELLGRGAFGIVFRAFDDVLQRVVALKVLAPQLAVSASARQRFLREARASAKVRHENVVQVYAVEERPLPFLVMEYIPGETLQQRLERGGAMPALEVAQIGRQIALGLAAAHHNGLVHRDIKPANILLESGPNPLAKITDFGLARSPDDASLTHAGIVAGTPMFMAPEQASGETLDHRVDLFSLSSVLYTMCTGQPPFRAKSTLEVLRQVAEVTPRPIPEFTPAAPAWLCALIARLHAKKPEDRFASAQEVADLLGHKLADSQRSTVLAAHPTVASATPAMVHSSRERKAVSPVKAPHLHLRRWAAAGAIGLLLLGGLGFTEASGVTHFSGTVIRLFSPDGTLVIEVEDPGISVRLDGSELIITGAGITEVRLKPGRYTFEASKDGKVVRHELVTIAKSGREVVRVSQEASPSSERKPAASLPDTRAADKTAWERSVSVLPGEQRVRAVAIRLQELNPGFDGALQTTIEHGVVTGLNFNSTHVSDLSPVRVLTGLRSLGCNGSDAFKTQLIDKSNGQLNVRSVDKSKLSDLAPLKGLPLTDFSCANSNVYDLTPLEGMKLTRFRCASSKVFNLSPLAGMPLETLDCGFTGVANLAPLKGMKLSEGEFGMTEVADLRPLQGMPLRIVGIGRHVTDLTPLKGMPLELVNAYGAERLADLAPLTDMRLVVVNLQGTQVSDIAPLKGMPLSDLNIPNTKVNDLTPLTRMNTLRNISLDDRVTNLSPLTGLALETLHFRMIRAGRDAAMLRAIPSLKAINGKPAPEFWKEFDVREKNR